MPFKTKKLLPQSKVLTVKENRTNAETIDGQKKINIFLGKKRITILNVVTKFCRDIAFSVKTYY